MFKKKALTTAVQAVMVVSAATLMQGCNLAEENSTSKVSGTFQKMHAPSGTVIGVVQDTNGNPLSGVQVFLGNKSARTNAGGQYQFNNVAVTETTDLGATGHNPLQVTIVSPSYKTRVNGVAVTTNYLGATVTVTPKAQIDGMDNAGSTADAQTGNQVTTFVDGYTASAGTAVLAALDATVTGVLRNKETGLIVANQDVALDLVSVGSGASNQQQGHNATSTSFSTGTYTTKTDAEGRFTFVNVPNDSSLNLVATSFTANGNAASGDSTLTVVNTNAEVQLVNVADVFGLPIPSDDILNPYVTRVSGLATPAGTTLDRGVDGTGTGIKVTFSEPIANTADGQFPVVIFDATNNTYYDAVGGTAVRSADGKSLTVTSATAFPAGALIQLHFAQASINDLSGNNVQLNDQAALGWPVSWPNDSIGTGNGVSNVNYLIVPLQMWVDENVNAAAVTAVSQLKEDTVDSTANQNTKIANLNLPVFNDVNDYDAGVAIQGLNYQGDNVTDKDAEVRLQALNAAITNSAAIPVKSDVARITLTTSNASAYNLTVSRGGADITAATDFTYVDLGTNTITTGAGNTVNGVGADKLVAQNSTAVEIVLGTVRAGDQVTITPVDDFGVNGTATTLTLVDNVEPTAVIQNAYGKWDHENGSSNSYGDGGELSLSGLVSLTGTPNWNLTIGLLDNDCGLGTNVSPLACDDLDDELMAHNSIDQNTSLPNLPVAANVYDAPAYAAFSSGDLSRTVGIAVSENLSTTLIGTPPSALGGVALTNYTVNNDVLVQDDAGVTDVDLINVTVADILALAATNTVSTALTLDLSNTVEDLSGNAASYLKLFVRDRMVPLVVDAEYTGERISITFNEAVAVKAGDTIKLGPTVITLSPATIAAHMASSNTTPHVLNVLRDSWVPGTIQTGTHMTLPLYDETPLDTGTAYAHGRLSTGDIADVLGNKEDAPGLSAGVTLPDFALKDTLGAMSISVNAPGAGGVGYSVGSNLFTVTYTSNHRINMMSLGGATSTSNLSNVQTAAAFAISGGGAAVDGTDSNTAAVLSANGKVLTVTIATIAPLAVGNAFDDVAGAIISTYDATDNVNPSATPTL